MVIFTVSTHGPYAVSVIYHSQITHAY